MVVEEWWNQPPPSHQSQPQSLNGTEAHFSLGFPPESSERAVNGSEEQEDEEIASPLTTSFDPTDTRARIHERVQGATTTPDPHTRRVDETDEILAAAALQRMQHPMTIPDASQNSFVRSSVESAGRWPALGNVSQGNQITLGSGSGSGSGEIAGPSHATNLPWTGGLHSTWIPGHRDETQRQSELNSRRLYVPDPSSDAMEPPHKRPRLDHQTYSDAAVPVQNYDDQAAMIDSLTSIAGQGHIHSSQRQIIAPPANATSVSTAVTSLQQNEALREEMGQYPTTAMAGNRWNFVEDFTDDLWNFDFDLNFIDFPITSTRNVGFYPGVTDETADGDPSFSMS